MNLKYITFTFENCETFTIRGEHIGAFGLEGFHKRFLRIGEEIVKFEEVENFFIEIHKSGNTPYDCFGIPGGETMLKFDRILHYDDITHIEFLLDGEYHHYGVAWENDFKEENPYQSSIVSKCGHLYINISKNSKIDDFVDSSIDDEEEMSYHFTDLGMEVI